MSKLALRSFGGMMPIRESRLLPDASAELAVNTWFYSGNIEGIAKSRAVHTLDDPHARSVFRVPKGSPRTINIQDSYWLEFEAVTTTVVRSPNTDVDDPRYYIADGFNLPRYTTLSRLEDGEPTLLLGIPQPRVAPGVTATGGWQTQEVVRSYSYTWVSKYQEEGPPSEPSPPVTGRIDAVWDITLAPPETEDTAERELAFVNIYRTVTSAQNISVYYFVEQLPITQTTYADTLPDTAVLNHSPLPSTFWFAPPAKLGGLTSLPNGMIAGFVGQEIWYCEPFRPHAWPAPYQQSVDFNIVGMAALEQMLVIGTQNVAYIAAGVHPSAVTLRMVTGSEPCVSQGSFAVVPQGVIYAGPNGLMLTNTGGAVNVTKPFISTDKWNELINLNLLHAAILNGAYYAFSGVYEGAFQKDAFQNNAFQVAGLPVAAPNSNSVTRDGILIDFNDARVAVSTLRDEQSTYNVIQDVWSAEILLIRDAKVWLLSLPDADPEAYEWVSKVFQLTKPENMAAMKVTYTPAGSAAPAVDVYAGNKLRLSRALPGSGVVFRLPSGFKSDNWQVRFTGSAQIEQVEVATSVEELKTV